MHLEKVRKNVRIVLRPVRRILQYRRSILKQPPRVPEFDGLIWHVEMTRDNSKSSRQCPAFSTILPRRSTPQKPFHFVNSVRWIPKVDNRVAVWAHRHQISDRVELV